MEITHSFLGNLLWTYNINVTYVEKDEQWLGILLATLFAIISTGNILKVYTPGQLISDQDMILPIKHKLDW